MLGRQLIASAYLSAGDVAPRRGSGESPVDLRERVSLVADWWTTGPRRSDSDRVRHALLTAAGELGARTVKVVAHSLGEPVAPDRLMAEFDRLADDARDAGTRVALEPMRSSDLVPTVEAAARVRTDRARLAEWGWA